jgi:hypothetical protein
MLKRLTQSAQLPIRRSEDPFKFEYKTLLLLRVAYECLTELVYMPPLDSKSLLAAHVSFVPSPI